SNKLSQATENLLLVAAQDKHAVAGTRRPKLGLHRNTGLLGHFAEAQSAGSAFLKGANALVGKMDETDITSHTISFLLLFLAGHRDLRRGTGPSRRGHA